MDITTQAALDTAPMHVKGIDGALLYDDEAKTKPVRIIFFSPGSAAASTVEARQTQRALTRMQENDGKAIVASAEDRRREAIEDLATMTAGFENLTYPPAGSAKGEQLHAALYADRSLGFIFDQGVAFVGKWVGFKPGSATT